jgi:hypothetical protein
MARAQAHQQENGSVKATAPARLESSPPTATATRGRGKTERKLKLVTDTASAPRKRVASRTRRAG